VEFMIKRKGLYLMLISIHGLIRGQNLELGRDADTGGQTTYVVELLKALSQNPRVERVDLLTRQVMDSRVDASYAVEEEEVAPGAYIIRIPFGPRRYLRKESLWPYLDNFADMSLRHLRQIKRLPDWIHSHYADAGYAGAQLANLLGVPLVHTGHSLGRVKKQRLKEKGCQRSASNPATISASALKRKNSPWTPPPWWLPAPGRR
jgi:sucrose-phosphate synthase